MRHNPDLNMQLPRKVVPIRPRIIWADVIIRCSVGLGLLMLSLACWYGTWAAAKILWRLL